MPRYFFHTRYKRYLPDEEGVELPDLSSAWSQASQMAGQVFRDLDGGLEPGHEWRLEVTDEQDNQLFVFRFSAESYDG